MRYQGGKSRIAARLAAVIRQRCTEDIIYEPFCGGGAMTLALAKVGFRVHARQPPRLDTDVASLKGW